MLRSIEWKRRPSEWVRRNLENLSPKVVGLLMWKHVAEGGEIDQVPETREGYRNHYQYHYDFRILIGDRPIYIETRFVEEKMGPTIYVVNIHDA